MKQHLLLFLLLLAGLPGMLQGKTVMPDQCTIISVTPLSQSISAEGGTLAFDILLSSGTCIPSFSGTTSWLSIRFAASAAIVTVLPNSGGARSAVITAKSGISQKTFTVSQSAYVVPPYINLSPTSLSYTASGWSQTFTISTNTPSQAITYSGCVSSITRLGNTVSVTCDVNNSTSPRTGAVTVTGGGISSSVSVSQAGATPYITPSSSTLSFASSGGSQDFTIFTNTSGQTVSYSGCVSGATLSGYTVSVVCGANNSATMRTGSVTVTGEGASSVISVNQTGVPSLYTILSPTSLNFTSSGGSRTFTISTNTSNQSITWTGCVSGATRSGSTVTVTCADNSTASQRTGTVTVTGGGVSSTVNVTQDGLYLTLSPASLSFPSSGGSQSVTIGTNTSNQTITYSGCVSGATRSGNTVTVVCAVNYSTSPQAGSVTVTGGGISSVIHVMQDPSGQPQATFDYDNNGNRIGRETN
jgi:hypothetical protein